MNVVISRSIDRSLVPENVLVVPSLTEAMQVLSAEPYTTSIENIFVVGGAGVYKETVNSEFCGRVYLTQIFGDYECDTFFPDLDMNEFEEVYDENVSREMQESKKGVQYQFHIYEKKTVISED